tara:strand:+ start:90 stop:518 length:429 start_codon:yes stop_codon:yes gene_type:complete
MMGEYKFESVRIAKIRQHKFLNKLNELGYLLNIDSIESYVSKSKELTDEFIKLQHKKYELEKKILEVDVEYSNILNHLKEENKIDINKLIFDSSIKDKTQYLEKLNDLGLVSIDEYESVKTQIWNEKRQKKQQLEYQLPKWM